MRYGIFILGVILFGFGVVAFGQAVTAPTSASRITINTVAVNTAGSEQDPTAAKPKLERKKPAPTRPVVLDEEQLRMVIFDTASRYIGKTERTGRNDADWIRKINRYNGLADRSAYCASAFYYCHRVNGLKLPVRSPGAVWSYFSETKRIVYRRGQRGNQRANVHRMDAVSLFVSHIEAVAQDHWDEEEETILLIGFNTGGGAGKMQGCYINRRRKRDIKAIANWITPTLKQYK